MLSLCQLENEINNLEGIENRKYDTVYVYDEMNDEYLTIDNVRIDSENDIVIDIKQV